MIRLFRSLFFITLIFILTGASLFSPSGFREEVVLKGLEFPVSMVFTPDGRLLYTERFTGRIRVIEDATSDKPRLLPSPLFQIGPVSGYFERGLLGITIDPEFEKNGFIYFFYSHRGSDPIKDPYRHRLMRITAKGNIGTDPVPILDNLPIGSQSESGNGNHNGGNIAFGPDGKLYLTMGDLATPSNSQDLDSFAGKVLRLNPDGSAPTDNPFYDTGSPGSPGSYIFALGLRNSFDFAFHPITGRLFATENGPSSNDELNILEPGKNYGWDNDQKSGKRDKKGYIDPILAYKKVIAPTGITFYTGDAYPDKYRNNLFFVDWNMGLIHRIALKGKSEDQLGLIDDNFYQHKDGLVDIVTGPDGLLYIASPGGIYRLVYIGKR